MKPTFSRGVESERLGVAGWNLPREQGLRQEPGMRGKQTDYRRTIFSAYGACRPWVVVKHVTFPVKLA